MIMATGKNYKNKQIKSSSIKIPAMDHFYPTKRFPVRLNLKKRHEYIFKKYEKLTAP